MDDKTKQACEKLKCLQDEIINTHNINKHEIIEQIEIIKNFLLNKQYDNDNLIVFENELDLNKVFFVGK